MFRSIGLFSDVSCPHISSCILPNCLFSHKSPGSETKSIVTVEPHNGGAADSQAVTRSVRKSGEPDRKRRRLESDGEEISSKLRQPIAQDHSAQKLASRRSVSPPPVKRAAPSNDATKRASKAPEARTPGKSTAKISEALNPRLLKKAPASHDMRYKLTKLLHDQLVRLNHEMATVATKDAQSLVLSSQQLITMALDMEEQTAVGQPTVYSNVVKNKIMLYKKMKLETWRAEREEAIRKRKAAQLTLSESMTPVSKSSLATNDVVDIITGLTTEQEIEFVQNYLLTPLEGLSEHGYVTSVPTQEEVEQAKAGTEAAKGWEVCDRCKSRFQVFPGRRTEDGVLATGGQCMHHWGRAYFPDKDPNDPKAKRAKRYRCCNEEVGDSSGCSTSPTHVFKITEVKRLASVLQFEETPYSAMLDAKSKVQGPICIDGEMGYTVYGLELIRLTATAWPSGEQLLDILVRPVGEILDLNSRFSGVWPEEFATAVPYNVDNPSSGSLSIVESPAAARSLLYQFLTPSTPIIGHGLENDLNAVRLVHPTIIDTIFLYPHRAGLPFRNGLKNLMWQYLGKKIQVVDKVDEDGKPLAGGHDSKEDARAAGDLVRYKTKKNWDIMRGEGWKIEDGKFVEPPTKAGGLTVAGLEDPLTREDQQ